MAPCRAPGTDKNRAWCSRLSPQAAIPTQISSKRCLLKISTLNQLRTLNFGKSVMKTWKKCDKTRPLHFFLTIANGGSCQWEAKADLSDPASAALAEVGTCTLPGAQRRTRICITAPSSFREHQHVPRALGQYYTNVEFVNMFFKANFGSIWADILLLHRYWWGQKVAPNKHSGEILSHC